MLCLISALLYSHYTASNADDARPLNHLLHRSKRYLWICFFIVYYHHHNTGIDACSHGWAWEIEFGEFDAAIINHINKFMYVLAEIVNWFPMLFLELWGRSLERFPVLFPCQVFLEGGRIWTMLSLTAKIYCILSFYSYSVFLFILFFGDRFHLI